MSLYFVSLCWMSWRPHNVCEWDQEPSLDRSTRKVLHSGRLQPYSQTLDQAGKACKDKHSSIVRPITNYGRKKFDNIGPCFWVKQRVTVLLSSLMQLILEHCCSVSSVFGSTSFSELLEVTFFGTASQNCSSLGCTTSATLLAYDWLVSKLPRLYMSSSMNIDSLILA